MLSEGDFGWLAHNHLAIFGGDRNPFLNHIRCIVCYLSAAHACTAVRPGATHSRERREQGVSGHEL